MHLESQPHLSGYNELIYAVFILVEIPGWITLVPDEQCADRHFQFNDFSHILWNDFNIIWLLDTLTQRDFMNTSGSLAHIPFSK